MNPETTTLKESVLVWRRLAEPASVPALAFPFALLAVGFILFLAIRRRDELKQLRVHWSVQFLLLVILSFGLGLSPTAAVLLRIAGEMNAVLQMALIAAVSFVAGLFPAIVVMLAGGLLVVTFRRHKLEAVILSIVVFLMVLGGGCYVAGFFVQEAPFSALHATIEVPMIWLPVAALVGVVAAFYIGAMYFYDSRTVHWSVASLLGMCRFAVFCLLGICFFLPGCQDYETTVTEAKVLMLFDVSGSMDAVDGQEGEGVTTRQEKIINFLTSAYKQGSSTKTFVEHLCDATPVACYRFGGVLDEDGILFDAKNSKSWTPEQWRTWFRPDKIDKEEILKAIPGNMTTDAQRAAYLQSKLAMYASLREGTDVGGSVLQALQRESNSRIQAVVVFSDGNSNRGDEEAIRQVLERASNPKRPIHIITVGVGDYKQPVRIRINPLVAPQAVRTDDGVFEVRVPVFGDGLPGEEFEVTLEAQRVKDRNGIELKKEPVYVVGKQKGTFGGGGEFPFGEVLFKVNLEQLTKIKSADDAKGALQGQWNFTAKLPRHAREAMVKDEPLHVSQARPVMVNDSTLRVLLFASSPANDYQFVRTILAREVEAKRAKLTIYLQDSKGQEDVNQDVDGNHLLNDFPNKLERPRAAKDGKKGAAESEAVKEGDPMNLKSYDVIIAFDPDWTQLSKMQKELLREWVEGDQGGGLIFLGAATHMPRLIPPVNDEKFKIWDLKPIYSLLPVVLGRLPVNADPALMHDATIPYKLDFSGLAKGMDFLKLDDESPLPLAGWSEFFGRLVPEPFGEVVKVHPERGFHGLLNYLRVAKAKDGAEVIATINDPKAPKTVDGKVQPYFVSLRVGKGKTFYIGSSEMWRLRTFKEEYLQRFWVKLARYVSSGGGAKSFGRFSMAGEYVTGIIPIEAEVRDKDGFPLSTDASPVVTVRRVDGREVKEEKLPVVPLKAKKTQAKWDGTFVGSMRLDKEGFYETRIDIQGTDESITQTFEVKAPNVEMSDLRTNFPKLFNLATDATPAVLARLDEDTRQRLEGGKDRPRGGPGVKVDSGGGARLFFRLANGQPVSQCIAKVRPEEDKVKGAIHDMWDWGPKVYEASSWEDIPGLVWAMFGVPAAALLLVMLAMLTVRRWIAALCVVAALVVVEAAMGCVLAFTVPDELFQPSAFGVLLVVPPLICLLAAGILLVAERYLWVLAILFGMVLYLGVLLLVQVIAEPEWAPMKVDFTVMLLLIAALLSAEWFTRKMLRLA